MGPLDTMIDCLPCYKVRGERYSMSIIQEGHTKHDHQRVCLSTLSVDNVSRCHSCTLWIDLGTISVHVWHVLYLCVCCRSQGCACKCVLCLRNWAHLVLEHICSHLCSSLCQPLIHLVVLSSLGAISVNQSVECATLLGPREWYDYCREDWHVLFLSLFLTTDHLVSQKVRCANVCLCPPLRFICVC